MRWTGCGWETPQILLIAGQQLPQRRTAWPGPSVRSARGCWTRPMASPSGSPTREITVYVGRFILGRPAASAPAGAVANPVKGEITQYFKEDFLGRIAGLPAAPSAPTWNPFARPPAPGPRIYPRTNRAGPSVYCATRIPVAAFLAGPGAADHFHAGLTPETKKHVQEGFITGGFY